jgi:hypothetical protein
MIDRGRARHRGRRGAYVRAEELRVPSAAVEVSGMEQHHGGAPGRLVVQRPVVHQHSAGIDATLLAARPLEHDLVRWRNEDPSAAERSFTKDELLREFFRPLRAVTNPAARMVSVGADR